MSSMSKPICVITPGAGLNPAHYGYLQHLLLEAGYGVISGLLPTAGSKAQVTVQHDAEYIRERLLLPALDNEDRNVVLICHSYSGIPGSAAAMGLSPEDRRKEGKHTSVLGQIYIAAYLNRGGDGMDMLTIMGGKTPPNIRLDEINNLIVASDIIPSLFHDVQPVVAGSSEAATLKSSLTSLKSPGPPASWNSPGYSDRCAYIKCVDDRSMPYQVQTMLLEATGQRWITRDIQSSHSPQLSHTQELKDTIVELVQHFSNLSK